LRIVVVGAGRIGSHCASLLSEQGHSVTILDTDADKLSALAALDLNTIDGSGISRQSLSDAGTESCGLFCALTENDEFNALSCLVARKMGADCVIARVDRPESMESISMIMPELSQLRVVSPDYEAAMDAARFIYMPSGEHSESFLSGRMALFSHSVRSGDPLLGIAVEDMPARLGVESLSVAAVGTTGGEVIPEKGYRPAIGDALRFCVPMEGLRQLLRELTGAGRHQRNILIAGGGRLSLFLARQLSSENVKIIEKDKKACEDLADSVSGLSLVCADPTDEDVLSEERARDADAFLSLGSSDAENIVTSLYARKESVSCVITKLDKVKSVAREMGLDNIISPAQSAAYRISEYASSLQNSENYPQIKSITKLLGGKLLAAEIVVGQASPALGATASSLALKGAKLLAVERGRALLTPKAAHAFRAGDIAVASAESSKSLAGLAEALS